MPPPQNSDTTPLDQGLSMPAEWAPHEATWLAWPHDPLTWAAGVEAAEDAFVEMVRPLSEGERVELLVRDETMRDRVEKRLTNEGIGNTRLHVTGHADSWVRDYGPTFVTGPDRDGMAAVDWTFNAWGGKYDTLIPDDRLGALIAEIVGCPRFRVPHVMEGGAIEVNGQGTLLTTEQCLLNPNRNPDLDRSEIAALLHDHVGVTSIVWLGRGVEGDDTDGHVDDVARFVDPRTVVLAWEDEGGPNHEALADNLDRLEHATDQDGRPLDVELLPMPTSLRFEGKPLPASYANFYIGNDVVLLPTFGDARDEEAHTLLASLLPDREVVDVDAVPLVHGFGACHCLTQQQPRP